MVAREISGGVPANDDRYFDSVKIEVSWDLDGVPMSLKGTLAEPSRGFLIFATVALFVIWSTSFLAMSYLLGNEREMARMSPLGLTIARMGTASLPIAGYIVVAPISPTASDDPSASCSTLALWSTGCSWLQPQLVQRSRERSSAVGGFSVITTLVPLVVALLSYFFLKERIAKRKWLGISVGFCGVMVIALARGGSGSVYPRVVGLAMLAPVSWSIYTVLSKHLTRPSAPDEPALSSLVWSYAGILTGSILMLPFLPQVTEELAALDATGWLAVLYLSILCTVLGFTIWTWLLQHLPASTVGLTVLLNPPLTLIGKFVLTVVLVQVFVFSIVGQELVGGVVVLLGLAIAIAADAVSRPSGVKRGTDVTTLYEAGILFRGRCRAKGNLDTE